MFPVLLKMVETFMDSIVKRYRTFMLHLAESILRDPHLAEDAVQEALISINNNQKRLGALDSPKTKNYIFTITKHQAIAFYKKSKKDVTFSDPEVFRYIEGEQDIKAFTDQYGYGSVILSALEKLTEDERALICLYYGEGYRYREIAKLLETSEQVLRKRMQRIRKKMRAALQQEK